jgi:hypothetical protein
MASPGARSLRSPAPIGVETPCRFTLDAEIVTRPTQAGSQDFEPRFWVQEYSVSKPVLYYGSSTLTPLDTTAGLPDGLFPYPWTGCLVSQD